MKQPGMNLLVSELAEACKSHLFEQKWLVAPSRTIGYQWLDAVTRTGANTLNVRVTTLTSLAIDLAAPEMARQGAELIGGVRSELLVDQLFREQRNSPPPGLPPAGGVQTDAEASTGYLLDIEHSPGLSAALHRTITDLRRAGLGADDMGEDAFEVSTKGAELRSLLASYESALDEHNLVDYADMLRLAAKNLREASTSFLADAFVLIPEHLALEMTGLERTMWEAIPTGSKLVLGEDESSKALTFRKDGSVELFSAVGEVNEVREVLRRCVSGQIPFDDVEIVCTDPDTYTSLIYEISARVDSRGGLPATFANGIPVRYSRPARALTAWASWVREGFPQATLVQMIQDGLLQIELPEGTRFGYIRLGHILRDVPIGFGADLYLAGIDTAIAGLKERHEWKRPALVAFHAQWHGAFHL